MSYNMGNKSAEKWDEQTVLELLNDMASFAERTSAYSIVSVIVHFKLYAEWWTYISKKFKDNSDVFQSIKRVENIIEKNIVENTMSGDAKSATFSIFLLKNKFGYKDKTETDHTSGGDPLQAIININKPKK